MPSVQVDDFVQWRDAARALLAAGAAPHTVHWVDAEQAALPIGSPVQPPGPAEQPVPAPRLSRAVLERLEAAARHRAPERWAVLYRVVWRLAHGERDVASEADPDGARLAQMANQVERETHRMKAFLRFHEAPAADRPPRPDGRSPDDGDAPLVAWFEPEHRVLDAVAPHFVERLGARRFAIVTPGARVIWDGESLHHEAAPAGTPFEAPPPQADPAWDAYYRSTFNPSRTNSSLLRRQMPTRYWKNLPEARLIPGMLEEVRAGARHHAGASLSTTRRAASIPVRPAGGEGERDPLQPDDAPLQDCRRCDLWRNATQAVGGEGPPDAPLVLVGEQPGDEEDLRGHPFIGPAGRMLDDAIAQAGLQRDRLFLTNAVKHFKWEPRGKRRLHKTPGQKEIDACNVWLRSELDVVAAPVVVTLGATALGAVYRTAGVMRPPDSLTRLVGTTLRLGERWLIPTFHPSYVLRLPEPAQQQAAFGRIVGALQEAARLAEEAGRGA